MDNELDNYSSSSSEEEAPVDVHQVLRSAKLSLENSLRYLNTSLDILRTYRVECSVQDQFRLLSPEIREMPVIRRLENMDYPFFKNLPDGSSFADTLEERLLQQEYFRGNLENFFANNVNDGDYLPPYRESDDEFDDYFDVENDAPITLKDLIGVRKTSQDLQSRKEDTIENPKKCKGSFSRNVSQSELSEVEDIQNSKKRKGSYPRKDTQDELSEVEHIQNSKKRKGSSSKNVSQDELSENDHSKKRGRPRNITSIDSSKVYELNGRELKSGRERAKGEDAKIAFEVQSESPKQSSFSKYMKDDKQENYSQAKYNLDKYHIKQKHDWRKQREFSSNQSKSNKHKTMGNKKSASVKIKENTKSSLETNNNLNDMDLQTNEAVSHDVFKEGLVFAQDFIYQGIEKNVRLSIVVKDVMKDPDARNDPEVYKFLQQTKYSKNVVEENDTNEQFINGNQKSDELLNYISSESVSDINSGEIENIPSFMENDPIDNIETIDLENNSRGNENIPSNIENIPCELKNISNETENTQCELENISSVIRNNLCVYEDISNENTQCELGSTSSAVKNTCQYEDISSGNENTPCEYERISSDEENTSCKYERNSSNKQCEFQNISSANKNTTCQYEDISSESESGCEYEKISSDENTSCEYERISNNSENTPHQYNRISNYQNTQCQYERISNVAENTPCEYGRISSVGNIPHQYQRISNNAENITCEYERISNDENNPREYVRISSDENTPHEYQRISNDHENTPYEYERISSYENTPSVYERISNNTEDTQCEYERLSRVENIPREYERISINTENTPCQYERISSDESTQDEYERISNAAENIPSNMNHNTSEVLNLENSPDLFTDYKCPPVSEERSSLIEDLNNFNLFDEKVDFESIDYQIPGQRKSKNLTQNKEKEQYPEAEQDASDDDDDYVDIDEADSNAGDAENDLLKVLLSPIAPEAGDEELFDENLFNDC